jgi:hypothetical protein
MTGIRFPAETGRFSLHHRVQTGSGVHPGSLSRGGVKLQGREASSTELKNAWIYTSTPIRLNIMVLGFSIGYTPTTRRVSER